jgi:hypothetical protein
MSEAPENDLAAFVSRMGGEGSLRIEERLEAGYVRLRVAEAERRQAKHDIRCVEDAVIELLRNARDAGARHIFLATGREGSRRSLVVVDDGCGIPLGLRERIFEARVTSKLESVHMDQWGVHGRGMALYAIRENAEEACVVDSSPDAGSSLRVVFDTDQIPERADQSKWPSLSHDEDGRPCVGSGPHNILRACAEFALEAHPSCRIYVGSAAEMVASMRKVLRPGSQIVELVMAHDVCDVPLSDRIPSALDARELARAAASLGLEISERTAQRIIAGQIVAGPNVYARMTRTSGEGGRKVDLSRERRGLRLAPEDAQEFSRALEDAFDVICERYYLVPRSAPRIRCTPETLHVSFDFEQQD